MRPTLRVATTSATLALALISCNGNQALAPSSTVRDAASDSAPNPSFTPIVPHVDAAMTGQLSVGVTLPDGVGFPQIYFFLSSATGAPISSGLFGPVPESTIPTLNLEAPAGPQLKMTLTAMTTAGVGCGGESQPFVVSPGAPANVAITMVCGTGEYSAPPLQHETYDARCSCEL
jgi:hypothetical protein